MIGIEDSLWEKLDDDTKLKVAELKPIYPPCACTSFGSSNFYHFFFGAVADVDLDTCVNSMALISALVLTIPRGTCTVWFTVIGLIVAAILVW